MPTQARPLLHLVQLLAFLVLSELVVLAALCLLLDVQVEVVKHHRAGRK